MNFTTKGAAKRGVDLPVAIDKEHVPVLQVSLSVQLLQHLDDTLETVVHVPHPHDFEVKSKALEEVGVQNTETFNAYMDSDGFLVRERSHSEDCTVGFYF